MPNTSKLTTQSIFPAIRYADARKAISWLQEAFGFEPQAVYGEGDLVEHAQLHLAGGIIMLGSARADGEYPVRTPREVGGLTGSIYVVLDDAAAVDEHCRRATKAGAKIVRPIQDTDYGSHDYSALDLEGHYWTFGTYRPDAPT